VILITGGLGFIGSHTARALLDLGESCLLTQSVFEKFSCRRRGGMTTGVRPGRVSGCHRAAATRLT
jgi:nucleoside-diphosphate-sugar epimerase